MPSTHSTFVAPVLCAALLIGGCGRSTEPADTTRPTEALTFLRPAPDAPSIANPRVSFYAKRGEDRDVTIYYRPRLGQSDSTEFVEFRVNASSLQALPDGRMLHPGDSVLITLTVVDPARMIIDFQPSGLRFSSLDPAELEISFAEANDDLDGDGDVDADDERARRVLSIWRQESPGARWVRIGSVVDLELDEVEAELTGFSGYAVAF